MSALFHASRFRTRRAIALCALLLLAGCGSAEDHYQRGMKLLDQKDYVKAGLEFRNAVKLKKDLIPAWRELSQIEERNQNWEATAGILAGNPRGLVLWRDECSAWLGNIGKYGDGDRAFWLEAHGGRPYIVDRKKHPEPLRLDHVAVSIVGGIQPDRLATLLDKYCPSGVGKEGAIKLTGKELDEVLSDGSRWALKHGYASEADLARTEEMGSLDGADPNKVSDRAKTRGREQIGSLGAGNHFIEVDIVDQIFDEQAANVMGMNPGCLVLQIHCGSRGLGHQVCTDYVQSFQNAVRKYGIDLPDRELVCAPMDSPEGQAYMGAMRAAANFAFVNRQLLAHSARRAFEETFASKTSNWHLHQVYDIGHNMGKLETHEVDGKQIRVCVHRKGATRAFGPGSPGLPPEYQKIGQPVIIPGSMGTASWVLVGTEESMKRSFGSSCHGAGRVMSRSKAKKEVQGDVLRRELERRGIKVRAGSLPGLAEEAPSAYKDVDMVVETVSKAGIAKKVARLKPLAVIKG